MAYVDTSTPDQQQAQAPQGQQAAPTTSTGAGPAVSKSPTSNISNQVVGTNAPAQPFQNIGAYLTANAPQVGQEAQGIASGLNQTAGQITNDVNTAANNFTGQVNNATTNFTPAQATSLETSPTNFASNPSDVATFNALYQNATPYSGPTSFETTTPYQNVNTEATGAANTGATLNNFNGVQSYLQGLTPQSTAGTSALDTALLQGTPGAMAPINSAVTNLNALPTTLANATTAEDAAAQQAATTNAASATAANTAGQTAQTNFQTGLNKELANDVAATDAYNAAVQKENATASAGLPTFDQLGNEVSAFNTDIGYGNGNPNAVTLGAAPTLANQTIGEPTLNEAASPTDFATQQALEQIFGSTYSPTITAGATPFQAPTAPTTYASELAPELAALQKQLNPYENMTYKGQPVAPSGKPATDLQNIEKTLASLQGA